MCIVTVNSYKCIALADNMVYNQAEVINVIEKAKVYVTAMQGKDSSGHDHYHVFRVLDLALTIAREEEKQFPLNIDMVALIALLHDLDDRKLSPDTADHLDRARGFLQDNGVSADISEAVLRDISLLSFHENGATRPVTREGKCVQDADRLDAMGAIGIARTFAFGGSRGRLIYDPMDHEGTSGHTIAHFYEKLLKLKDLMNTETGKAMAAHRHGYMEDFLEEFFGEWEGSF